MTTPDWVPPLPKESRLGFRDREGWVTGSDGYTAEQMHAYAEQYRKAWVASLKPAAWTSESGLRGEGGMAHGVFLFEPPNQEFRVLLYKLDDQP
jgi:hypothetical protein